MLQLVIPGVESFNDETQEFVYGDDVVLTLEHSLISLSKWEMQWNVPFLAPDQKTPDQVLSYVHAMLIDDDVPAEVFSRLDQVHFDQISEYVNAKMTATWFREVGPSPRSREMITSELIYYWMTALNIPFECETWHLNRLFTLVRVLNEKNKPKQKQSRSQMAAERRALNEQRMKQYGTSG